MNWDCLIVDDEVELAKVKVIIKRCDRAGEQNCDSSSFQPEDHNRCENLRIDSGAMKVYINEKDAGFQKGIQAVSLPF